MVFSNSLISHFLISTVFVSVGASIFTEVQLKGDKNCEMNFLEKQFWLNFYCALVALIGHLSYDSTYLLQHFVKDFSGNSIRHSNIFVREAENTSESISVCDMAKNSVFIVLLSLPYE